MKKIIAWTLLLAMLLSVFAGCTSNQTQATDPVAQDPTVATPQADDNLAGAIAYLKAMYKEVAESTPADFQRASVVRVADVPYEVVWTTDASEDLVKIIPGEKNVTIDVNEDVTEDTPYVLTATITGTDGTTATASWNHFVPASLGSDFGAIIDMAYALEDGQALDNVATLTGVITSIDTPYDAGYKNVTVTIQIAGREDKPIQCYRLKGEGAADLWIGDTITVTGTLKNYKGTIEFDAGCELKNVVKGANEKPVAPEDPAEIVKAAYSLQAGESLPYEATLTGRVVFVASVYSETYKNITVTIAVGDMPIICYRLKGDEADTLNNNDIITVTGTLTNYNGFIEFASGSTLVSVEQREAPKQPTDPKAVVDAAYALDPSFYLPYYPVLTGKITKINTPYSAAYGNVTVTIVVEGREDKPIECYRMYGTGADNLAVGDTITVQGYMVNYKGKVEYSKPKLLKVVKGEAPETPEVKDPAADSTLTIAEAIALGTSKDHNVYTTGKYYVTGVITEVYNTTYGNMYIKDAAGNILTVYGTYSADGSTRYDKMATKPVAGDTITVYGVIGQYNGTPQLKNGWITAHNPAGETPDTPSEPVVPSDPAAGSTLSISEALTLGASKEHNVYTEGKYYVTGVITEVYNTTYGNMYIKDAAGNILTVYGTYSADGSTRYDKMATKPVAGDTITVYGVIGQYNGTPQLKNGWITAHTSAGGSGETPDVPETGDPAANSSLTIAEAIALGTSKDHNVYTTGKYYVTGVITEVYNTTYGNMYIKDAAGNILTVYGTYSADGSTRYDKMATKPVAGDTITVYGIIGQYNGTPQLKNGWITAHTSAGGSGDTTEPEAPEIPEVNANSSPAEIVAALKLLAKGEALNFQYTVTGTVTWVGTPSTTRGDITFNLDNGLEVYRLKCDAYNVIAVGDTVTVTGTPYFRSTSNGTPSMQNCTLLSFVDNTP